MRSLLNLFFLSQVDGELVWEQVVLPTQWKKTRLIMAININEKKKVKNMISSQKTPRIVTTIHTGNPLSKQWYECDIITTEVLAGQHKLPSNNTKPVRVSQLK